MRPGQFSKNSPCSTQSLRVSATFLASASNDNENVMTLFP